MSSYVLLIFNEDLRIRFTPLKGIVSQFEYFLKDYEINQYILYVRRWFSIFLNSLLL
jgi:hypothetical protein